MAAPVQDKDARRALYNFEQYCRANFPIQYTPEWFLLSDRIGGSDMYNLEHDGVAKLCMTKLERQIAEECCAAQHCEYRPWIDGDTTRAGMSDGAEFACAITDGASDESALLAREIAEGAPVQHILLDPYVEVRKREKDVVAMGWGTLFEPLLCNYVAWRINSRISCRDITHLTEGAPFRYSPDGAFIDVEGAPVLLEMKNPFSRCWDSWAPDRADQLIAPHLSPNDPGAIYSHYLPQVSAGMLLMRGAISRESAMNFAYAYYIEAIFRRTSRQGAPSAVTWQKMSWGGRNIRDTEALDYGIIGIYHNAGAGTREGAIELSRDRDGTVCHILSHLRGGIDGTFDPYYFADGSDPDESGTDAHFTHPVCRKLSDLPTHWKGKPLFAYLYWSLYGIHSGRLDAPSPDHKMDARLASRASAISQCMRAAKSREFSTEQKRMLYAKLCEFQARAPSFARDMTCVDILKLIDQVCR
jgi:hypothetical protein